MFFFESVLPIALRLSVALSHTKFAISVPMEKTGIFRDKMTEIV